MWKIVFILFMFYLFFYNRLYPAVMIKNTEKKFFIIASVVTDRV